ncbi:hypothetical protein Ciccas_005509 [Cichlidogyrus casuarinus]|uniref:MULE transposase domain-containing protein n=1 Tax=Cichlidogyrus casuarinus TaxID=1844966 RepID=A0ABD2Q8W6_9PLAT
MDPKTATMWVVDTGARHSVVTFATYQRLRQQPTINETSTRLLAANGTEIPTKGSITYTLGLGHLDFKKPSTFIVADTTYNLLENYVCSAILVPTAGGGIPHCMMFHQKELIEQYVVMFELLFKSQQSPFFGWDCPQFIVTDDSKAEKPAIKVSLQDAEQILCLQHMKRNIKSYQLVRGLKKTFTQLASRLFVSPLYWHKIVCSFS